MREVMRGCMAEQIALVSMDLVSLRLALSLDMIDDRFFIFRTPTIVVQSRIEVR